MDLEQKIEAVLFYKTEPVRKADLAQLFSVSDAQLSESLVALHASLQKRGVRLLQTDEQVQLMSAPEASPLIEHLRKEELKRDIGKAGAEVLAIVLYREPVTRAEIDFIRGVNSTFVLRNLLIRGLITRTPNPHDQRSYRYKIAPELLAHLGVTKKEEVPGYQEIMDELDRYKKEHASEEEETPNVTSANTTENSN